MGNNMEVSDVKTRKKKKPPRCKNSTGGIDDCRKACRLILAWVAVPVTAVVIMAIGWPEVVHSISKCFTQTYMSNSANNGRYSTPMPDGVVTCLHQQMIKISSPDLEGHRTVGAMDVMQVSRREWMPDTNVSELFAGMHTGGSNAAVPIVLTQSPAMLWPARHWTLSYVSFLQCIRYVQVYMLYLVP